LKSTFLALLVLASGAAFGAALVAVASRFGELGPIVTIALVGVPMVLTAAVIDARWGVLAVFATFPIGAIATPAAAFDLEVSQVAVLAIGAAVIVGRLASGKTPLPWPTQLWWILALIAWTFVGLPSAIDQALAIKQIAALMLGTFFACLVVAACRSIKDVTTVLIGFIAVAVFIGAGAFLQGAQFRSTFGGARVAGRAVSSFDHSNQLGSLSAMTALIVIALIAGARTRRSRWIGIAAVLVLLGGQALTLSRGAWIGTMVGVLFLAAVLPHARRALIALSAPLLAIGLAIAVVAPDSTQVQVVQQRFESLTVRSPYDDRTAIWLEARREILEEPVTGQGAGNFPAASTRAASGANTVFAYHAHNIFLTWAAETGLPGLFLIVGFVLSLILGIRRARRRAYEEDPTEVSYRALTAGLSAALIALAAQGIVDYTLRNAVIFFAVMGVIGCLLATIRLGPDESDARPGDTAGTA
jgi:O-antigen ligase